MKRILIVGQSGAGKSTITNCIVNNSVEFAKLNEPAGVSRTAEGCTKSLQNYVVNANFIIHDTVGFSDREEESPKEIVETLRKILLSFSV